MATLDVGDLEGKVQQMYRQGRAATRFLSLRNGPSALPSGLAIPRLLAAIPEGAVESFAGVGYFFDLASQHRETVIDLGSGSGMDTLIAAGRVAPSGRVVGVDFTLEQLTKHDGWRRRPASSMSSSERAASRICPPTTSFDCVISNGVVTLRRQATGLRRNSARAAAGRPARDRRHRHHATANRGNRQQRQSVGLLYRRRHHTTSTETSSKPPA